MKLRNDINYCMNYQKEFGNKMQRQIFVDREAHAHNSGFKKLAVQWLNQTLCFVSSSVLADSFVLRNRQLLKPANR